MLPPRLPLAVMTAAVILAVAAFDAPDAQAQTPSASAPAPKLDISIAAQPLGNALNELARQARLQLLVEPSLVAGRTAPAVAGRMSAEKALARMLDGSHLVAESKDGTVTVRRAPTASAPASPVDTVLPAVSVTVGADDAPQRPTEQTGAYTILSTTAGSKIALPPKETPQSVSVLTRAEMNDFQLNSINDALRHVTGVTV
ncbi:MAG: Ferripyoverdine receptor [Burkholderia gladioli]|nr:MAG: Ferripyoverdine receptor [Burkholderia gladioli]